MCLLVVHEKFQFKQYPRLGSRQSLRVFRERFDTLHDYAMSAGTTVEKVAKIYI